MPLWAELQRRRVFRAVIGYGVVAFALLQVVEPVMHGLHLPEVTLTFVVVGLACGFPLTVALAWVFDIRAQGIERSAPTREPGLRGARLALSLAGIGALAAAPGLLWYFLVRGPARQTAAAAAPSIAVIPFANLSPDAANEYFSDGLTDELIDALSHVEGLQVASRTSAFSFKGKPAQVGDIAARLKVATVLEGSVRRDGPRLRLTAQLVDARDGYHLWSQTYERELKDVFAVEAELARSIVATLRPRLLPQTKGAPPTEDLEAHDLFLRGRYFANRRTPDSLRKAISLFEQAIARDPRYAIAYSGLADAYVLLVQYAGAPAKEMMAKARASAERALALNPDTAQAHAALGLILRGEFDWTGSEAEFRRALALEPGDAEAHLWYGTLLTTMGRLEEARPQFELASRLDPTSVTISVNLALAFVRDGNYQRAIEQARKTLELDPGASVAHFALALTYLQQRKFAEAQQEFNLSEQGGLGPFLGFRGVIYASRGKTAEARKVRAALDDLSRPVSYRDFNRATIDIALGELDRAFAELDAAIAQRDIPVVSLKTDPMFDPLRKDARFGKLIEKMRL